MSFYSKKKLMEVVKDRGYTTERAVAQALVGYFEKTPRVIENKIRTGNLTMEECEVIGSMFEMTMKEYYDTFMNGLFQENYEGHYVAYVEDPYMHLHPYFPRKQRKNRTNAEKRQDILDEIDSV